MKISKDKDGKLIINGEDTTMLFPKHGEKWFTVEGIDESMIEVQHMCVQYSETGGTDKIDDISKYFNEKYNE